MLERGEGSRPNSVKKKSSQIYTRLFLRYRLLNQSTNQSTNQPINQSECSKPAMHIITQVHYGPGLVIQRTWVRILAPDTKCFFSSHLFVAALLSPEKAAINEKEAEDGLLH